MKRVLFACSLLTASQVAAVRNILDYGAIPDLEDTATAYANSDAIAAAITAANATDSTDREVLVPADTKFTFMPVHLSNLSNITITVNGTLLASKEWLDYPVNANGDVLDIIAFDTVDGLKWQGTGVIDGQGFMWWQREYIQMLLPRYNGRPHLNTIRNCRNVEWTGIKWQNSPMYHLKQDNCDNLYFHDMEIYVDMWGQMNLGKFFGMDGPHHRVPTYPLNTDGIDPAASNVLIERVKITNDDDAIAVKPSHNTDSISPCSEHIIVRDVEVVRGVGMTIGSVPPRDSYACIRDVHFSNITFHHPYKAIYIKTNPGTTSSMLPGSGGEISNITYTDITIHNPIWWNIYIGPQQQKQPDKSGPGCMLYPFAGGDETCST